MCIHVCVCVGVWVWVCVCPELTYKIHFLFWIKIREVEKPLL